MKNRILYLLDTFPKLSDTFIQGEIRGLLELGCQVQIWGLRSERSRAAYHDSQDLLSSVVSEELKLTRERLLRGLSFITCHPLRFLVALAVALYHEPLDGLVILLQSCCAAGEIVRRRIHHIHSHFVRRACKHALMLSILTGIPYSFTTHAPQFAKGYFEPSRSDFYLRAKYATKVITTTNHNRSHLESVIGIPSHKIAVVPPGIDLTRFRPPEYQVQDERIVLSVARLDREKAHNVLLKACLCLKNLSVSFECVIIGDGPERGNLLGLLEQFGLGSSVHLVGAKSNTEVVPYYQRASVFVMPSLLEALGVAAIEAMACGVPVVATRVGGVPELVEDGRTGFLVEFGDHLELARKIALLLENSELRSMMGGEARSKAVALFNINEQVRRLAQALDYG